MSAPLIFGGCGCGRNATRNEQQTVVAYIPFNFGFVGSIDRIDGKIAIGNALTPPHVAIFNTTQIPATIFLKATYANGSTSWDRFGNLLSNTGSGSLQSLSDPYTYADAVAAAIGLLNSVTLLNPDALYQVQSSVDVKPRNFCYGSENAGRVNPTNALYVTWGQSGEPQIQDASAVGAGGYAGVIFGPLIVPGIGSGVTLNGTMTTPFVFLPLPSPVGGNLLSGYIVVSKCAIRTANPIISERIGTFNPGPAQTVFASNGAEVNIITPYATNPGQVTPVNVGPGEFILTPDMVPGFGSLQYSTDPAPPLPPA